MWRITLSFKIPFHAAKLYKFAFCITTTKVHFYYILYNYLALYLLEIAFSSLLSNYTNIWLSGLDMHLIYPDSWSSSVLFSKSTWWAIKINSSWQLFLSLICHEWPLLKRVWVNNSWDKTVYSDLHSLLLRLYVSNVILMFSKNDKVWGNFLRIPTVFLYKNFTIVEGNIKIQLPLHTAKVYRWDLMSQKKKITKLWTAKRCYILTVAQSC